MNLPSTWIAALPSASARANASTTRSAKAISAHDLAIQPILVGARVERISSARAPEMCPFSKTIRENQTVRETFQGFASPTGQRPGAQDPVPPPRSALTSDGAAARGRCLFAHRGKPGWHSGAVFEAPALVAGFESHARAAKHRIPAHDLAIQPILGRRSGQAD